MQEGGYHVSGNILQAKDNKKRNPCHIHQSISGRISKVSSKVSMVKDLDGQGFHTNRGRILVANAFVQGGQVAVDVAS